MPVNEAAVADIWNIRPRGCGFAVNVTVATPEAFVVAEPALKAPAVASLTANITVSPDSGVELLPKTVAVTVTAPPALLKVDELSVTTTELATITGVPMASWALPVIVPELPETEARIVTDELSPAGAAVNVEDATPDAFVVAVAGLNTPAVELIEENVTDTLGTATPLASVTVAVTVVFPPFAIAAAPSVTCTAEGAPPVAAGVPMIRFADPVIVVDPVVTEARMVTAESLPAAAAVKVDVAAPDALVTAGDWLKVPAVAAITEKVTLTFGITAPFESVTVAVTVVFPPFAMDDAPRVTWTRAGADPVETGTATSLTLHPAAESKSDSARIIERTAVLFIISSDTAQGKTCS